MIKINPKGGNPLSLDSVKNDSLVFDVPAKTMYVTGVPFTKTYEIFKKNTELGGGIDGLVPAPSYLPLNTRFLREDGAWDIPDLSNIRVPHIKLTNGSLNTLLESGRWYYSDNNIEGTPNGIKSFELYVGKTSDNQIYLKLISDTGIIWFRQYKDNNWNKWIRWYTDMNTDFKVTQSSDNTTKFRPIILGYNNATQHLDLTDTITLQVYTNTSIYALPSTGTLYANRFEGVLHWDNVINKPTDFKPSQHKQAYKADECTSYTEDTGYLGVTPAAVRKAFTIIDPKKHTHSTDEITALTGYTEVLTKASLTPTDTLNRALGKLDYKANLGVSAYDMINAAYDGDGKIENLTEILKVLEGISDTLTIKGILGNYRLLNESLFYGSEVESKFWINRCNPNRGEWAYEPISIYKGDKTTVISRYGVLGENNNLTYTYIGSNSYSSLNNLRIYPNGTVTAPIFQGKLNYTYLTGSTSTPNQVIVSTGTADKWTLKTLGSHAFDSAAYLPLAGGTMNNKARISHGGDMYIGRSDNQGWVGMQDICSASSLGDTMWSIRINGNAVFKKVTGSHFISNVGTGTLPYACTSTTLNSNLNADLLDGQHGTRYLKALGGSNYITFTVGGDANTYYPVVISSVGVYYPLLFVNISRTYSEQAPDSWNTATHRGGLTLTLLWNGSRFWDGNGSGIPCYIVYLYLSYCTMFGGKDTSTSGEVVWLRGGGAIYHVHAMNGTSVTATVYTSTYTDSAERVFAPITTPRPYSVRWPGYSQGADRLTNTLTFSAGKFTSQTYNGSSATTVNVPTHTSHLTNDSGFLTQHLSLANYYTKSESDSRFVNVTGDTMSGALTVNSTITGTLLKSTIKTGTAPLGISSTTVVSNLNSDLLDGYHETAFYRNRGTQSIKSSIPTNTELIADNGLSGSWFVSFPGALGHLVQFNAAHGSTKYMLFYSHYNSSLYWRNSTDSNLNNKVWKTILDNSNYTSLVIQLGTATKGSASLPIYLNAGVPTACSTTLGVSITGNSNTTNRLQSTGISSGTLSDKISPGYLYHSAGGNSVADKPNGTDAFGMFTMLTAGGYYGQLLISSNTATGLYWRTATSYNGGWKKILDSSNFTEYTVTKTGGGASGTWNISISGSSTRTIGTLNLAAGKFSTKTFNGSANVSVNIPTHTSHLTNDSGFITSSTELSSNITTITKSLKVTLAWMDTGITSTNLPANGTYIVLVQVNANDSTGAMYNCYSSGIMCWYRDNTNDTETDEIILHRSGHGYRKTIYLRTVMQNSGVLKLLIGASSDIGKAYTYTFKFKRII